MGEVVAGRYELEELAGRGGMSSVYRAHDRLLERKVALKLLHEQYGLDEDYVERFRREARSAAQLSHPNIVTVIDRGEQDGRQFIVFEYVDGETLKQLVERRGPLPVRQALELILQVARALGFAHEQGLVHRDVKPQNVLLDDAGRAKVTDFGIARSIDLTSVTQTGTVLGSSDYIAPEQASGDPVDAQSDIYSLGVVVYELLTGEVPFPADNFVAAALRHVNEPPPSVLERRPDVPLRLVATAERMLAKDPADRFASMKEVIAELEACLHDLGEPEGDMTVLAQRPAKRPAVKVRAAEGGRTRRRRLAPIALPAAVLAALAAAAIGLFSLLDSDGGSPGETAGKRGRQASVRLAGIGSYDPPPGDLSEHDAEASRATDGDPLTFWTTEQYESFDKPGVGLMLDAGRRVALTKLTIVTDLPGFSARVRAGLSTDGRFTFRSPEQEVSGRSTTIELQNTAPARYFVVWITALAGDRAHVNEVRGIAADV